MTEPFRIVVATLLGALATSIAIVGPISLANQWGDASRSAADVLAGLLIAVGVGWSGGLWYLGLPGALGWYVAWRVAFRGIRGPLRRHAYAAWTGAAVAIATSAVRERPPGAELAVVALVAFAAATASVLAWRLLFGTSPRAVRECRPDPDAEVDADDRAGGPERSS